MAREAWNMNTTTTTVQLKRGDIPFGLRDCNIPAQPPATPSEWFARRFPAEVNRWGCPFLEEVVEDRISGSQRITATALNDNFFVSTLSDSQLGHSVVFYEPERRWYFLEPRDDCFYPTSDAKLMTLLSCLLVRCAEETPVTVDKVNLFVKFRAEEGLRAVVKKARSILEADATFFSPASPNRRVHGEEQPNQAARRFIQSAVKPQPGQLLSISDCYAGFEGYCRNNGVEPVAKKAFRQMIVEIIREEFGLGLRADMKNTKGRFERGWKGLAVESAGRG